jgi:hypothetical protein
MILLQTILLEDTMNAPLAEQPTHHVFPWEAIGAPLSPNAVLHGPLLTHPLEGVRRIEEFYQASHAVAGSLQPRWSWNQGDDSLLLADQHIDKRPISSGFWLRRDSSGAVVEISHGLSPFPRLGPFHVAMRTRLEGFVPNAHWELDEATRVTSVVGEEGFPPFQLAEDVRFHSPLVDQPLEGADRVRRALAEATVVYGTRRYLFRCRAPGVFGSVWEAAVEGHIIRCVSLFFMNPAGEIKDIVACMLPYPALARVYFGVKERNSEKLGAAYFSV